MSDTVIESPYVVSLEGGDFLPPAERIRAEARYSGTLQKALGGADQVVAAYRAFQSATESDEPPQGDIAALATAWQRACNLAQQAGMRDLGEGMGAYFEIRLV
ncbi:hypothetical protein GT347_01275 [Xylophilus rhododendri]|uniref:Uncharacterized protein n=1 Tax=Xylophilus rhododendri TaxID=2697032 RepID=A0A857J0X0_9BURK|nr:hypothetical protein [Xylophilus rhododendri]QHI96742.1 hypothetical protein GT347_01275 [Xylophilus rhododendri]